MKLNRKRKFLKRKFFLEYFIQKVTMETRGTYLFDFCLFFSFCFFVSTFFYLQEKHKKAPAKVFWTFLFIHIYIDSWLG